MERFSDHPHSLLVSTRLYQALLALYPRDFRRAYGGSMLQVFRDCCRRALRESGTPGLLSLWGWTLYDLVKSVIEEYAQRGVSMSKQNFYQLSGWAMIIGPIVFMLGLWAESRPPYISYAASSLPIDRYAEPAATPLVVIGMLFMCLGILGLMLRYVPTLAVTSIFLGIAILAGVISTVGMIGLEFIDSRPWWDMFILGITAQHLALAFFGFFNLRRKLLPRWNGLPVLSLWLPIPLLLSIGLIPLNVSGESFALLWLLSVVIFAGLGYLLKSGAQPVHSAGTV